MRTGAGEEGPGQPRIKGGSTNVNAEELPKSSIAKLVGRRPGLRLAAPPRLEVCVVVHTMEVAIILQVHPIQNSHLGEVESREE